MKASAYHTVKIETDLPRKDLVWLSVRELPFDLYGLYEPKTEAAFIRMPAEVGDAVSESVKSLYRHSAGGRVRFSTDSPIVAVSAKYSFVSKMGHMTLCGSAGFDLYEDKGADCEYVGSYLPDFRMNESYEGTLNTYREGMRFYTLNLPLYSAVTELYIGFLPDSSLGAGAPYAQQLPVAFYGSSITQGACASKPGDCYEAILSRRFSMNYLNLGFSGSAKGEPLMADYIAGLPMRAFVLDYDHNAPSPAHLAATHEPFFRKVREKQPDLPIIMMTQPIFHERLRRDPDCCARRETVFETYMNAVKSGDKNVWFIDGDTMLTGGERCLCTVDGLHPSSVGFVKMADAVGIVLREILR